MSEITQDEILEAIRAAVASHSTEGEPGITTEEFRLAMKYGEDKARRVLRQMIRAGQIECLRVRRRSVMDPGRMMTVPGFRPK